MSLTKKQTLEFKKRQCGNCTHAIKRVLRQGRSPWCQWEIDHGQKPDIRNGHCAERGVPKKGEKDGT